MNEQSNELTLISEEEALSMLKSSYSAAEEILEDVDKIEEFLQRIEKELSKIPQLGKVLSYIPVLISLVRFYIKKEYTTVPYPTIVSIIAALIYYINPFDIINDKIKGFGKVDDIALIYVLCAKVIKTDLDMYKKWREQNGKLIDIELDDE